MTEPVDTVLTSAEVRIPVGSVTLDGELRLPERATGVVMFVHGSGSSRFSPRNVFVAEALRERGLGTLLFDLLTAEEETADFRMGHLRFDIDMLAERLIRAAGWVVEEVPPEMPLGFFGASTGAAAALVAAAYLGREVSVVVSRGGRPDLAGNNLERVTAPTLLIVGGADDVVLGLNQAAFEKLTCEKRLHVVPGAGHLFEEPGTLGEVADQAAAWFGRHLRTG
jgi:pimeloyl-ACP methyl ester carboxylesterase